MNIKKKKKKKKIVEVKRENRLFAKNRFSFLRIFLSKYEDKSAMYSHRHLQIRAKSLKIPHRTTVSFKKIEKKI